MIPKFKTLKERNKWLTSNKKRLIELKKATTKQCDVIEFNHLEKGVNLNIEKADLPKDSAEVVYRTIVGNTYGWLDSHDDVHIKGIFSKSIKDRGDKVIHLHDHIHQLSAEIGDNLKVYEKEINWLDLGLDKEGKTTALLMDSAIQKDYNTSIFKKYQLNRINQHSVGMQYVKVILCINDSEEKEEFANWNKYINQVANEEEAIEKGYFFAVLEAKLIEISAVIQGSNILTPTIEPKNEFDKAKEILKNLTKEELKEIHYICQSEPGNHSKNKKEPLKDTQKSKNYFINSLKT